eukprot:12905586-Prorocentrum_lima.AAC.1
MSCPRMQRDRKKAHVSSTKKTFDDIEKTYAAKESAALAKLEKTQSQIVRLEQVEQRLIQTVQETENMM